MTVEKAFFHWFDCPDTKRRRTLLMQRFIDEELIPKFEIMVFDGEYKTRTRFYNAIDEQRNKIEKSIPVEEKRFDMIVLYGADFREFIEKCESLEK